MSQLPPPPNDQSLSAYVFGPRVSDIRSLVFLQGRGNFFYKEKGGAGFCERSFASHIT